MIDEVQKIENWSEVVKREWDAATPELVPKYQVYNNALLTAYKGRSLTSLTFLRHGIARASTALRMAQTKSLWRTALIREAGGAG